jgi:hypothetical protein
MKDTLKKLTNKILNETIESKANDLMEKLKLNKSEENMLKCAIAAQDLYKQTLGMPEIS